MEPASTLSGIKVGNRIKWQKGAIIRAEHEGVGLSTNWFKTTEKNSIEIRYETAADDLQFNYGTQELQPDTRHPWYQSDYTTSGANIYQ